jgi:hypothetical protein
LAQTAATDCGPLRRLWFSTSAEIAALRVPNDQPRVLLRIRVAGRDVSADIAAKSVRKAIATIREAGVDACVALIQGKLGPWPRGETQTVIGSPVVAG